MQQPSQSRNDSPAVDSVADETARQATLIEALARRIEQAGLVAPAILFLESHKPFAFLASQLLWMADPLVSLIYRQGTSPLASLLESPAAVERLLTRLEAGPGHKGEQP